MIGSQLPQTYSGALSRALRVEVFIKRMYGQNSTQAMPPLSLILSPVPLQQVSSSNTPIQRGHSLEKKGKRPFQAKASKKGQRSNKKQSSKDSSIPNMQQTLQIECLTRQGVCYHCHQPRHIAKSCPVAPTQVEQLASRVFNITKRLTRQQSSIRFLSLILLFTF